MGKKQSYWGCQRVLLSPDKELSAVLDYICTESNKIYNFSVYYAKPMWFKAHSIVGRATLCAEMKHNRHFTAMSVSASQQVCNGVAESFKSFQTLNKLFYKGKLTQRPKQPSYRKSGLFTEKRNRQMRDGLNKAARVVVHHCIEHGIGTIVFGWNQGQKNGANVGRKANQMFVQLPTTRLNQRIAQLCEVYGIQFIETEESYTSKASALDNDEIPVFGEKTAEWTPSGRKVKRGLYRTAHNWSVNADCNGAFNILRKVARTAGIDLSGLSRGALTTPVRIRIWTLNESPCL